MLEDLRKKIEKLIALYEAEKAENIRLRDELQECKKDRTALREQLSDLESEIETRKLKDAFNGGSSPEAVARVTSLVKDIRKCIQLLEES